MVLYCIYMIYKAVSQSKDGAQKPPVIDDEPEAVIYPKKPAAGTESSIVKGRQKKALRRTLPIHGEGSRFETVSEPLTAAEVAAPAIPAATLVGAEPHLGSLTGNYELPVSENKASTPPANLFRFFDSYESVRYAVVLSEILGKPKGMED